MSTQSIRYLNYSRSHRANIAWASGGGLVLIMLLTACGSARSAETPSAIPQPAPDTNPAIAINEAAGDLLTDEREWIAFISVPQVGGDWEISFLEPDNPAEVILVTNDEANQDEPAWSLDGLRLVFSSYTEDAAEDIFVLDLGDLSVTRLTASPGFDGSPDWSPDGGRIVFTSWRDANPQIYVMNADGSQQTGLTQNPPDGSSPTWSPDGAQIAFISTRDGNPELYVTASDGGAVSRLTENPSDDQSPAWSPDGSMIAFESNRDDPDNYEIYLLDVATLAVTRLTDHPGYDGQPEWSPDGIHIVFVSEQEGSWQLAIMDADGSNVRVITFGLNGVTSPAWRP